MKRKIEPELIVSIILVIMTISLFITTRQNHILKDLMNIYTSFECERFRDFEMEYEMCMWDKNFAWEVVLDYLSK